MAMRLANRGSKDCGDQLFGPTSEYSRPKTGDAVILRNTIAMEDGSGS